MHAAVNILLIQWNIRGTASQTVLYYGSATLSLLFLGCVFVIVPSKILAVPVGTSVSQVFKFQ